MEVGGAGGKADPASRRSAVLNETLMKHLCLGESGRGGGRGGGDSPKKKKKTKRKKNERGKTPQTCFVSLSRHFYICRI